MTADQQIRLIAARIHRGLPRNCCDLEDLVAEGWIGQIKAERDFDAALGCKLKTFAESKIRGAILDYLRRCDMLSRWEREKVKAEIQRAPEIVSLERDAFRIASTTDAISDDAIDARSLLARLDPRSRRVIEARFLDDLTLAETAALFGLSISGVCKLINRALATLKQIMRRPSCSVVSSCNAPGPE